MSNTENVLHFLYVYVFVFVYGRKPYEIVENESNDNGTTGPVLYLSRLSFRSGIQLFSSGPSMNMLYMHSFIHSFVVDVCVRTDTSLCVCVFMHETSELGTSLNFVIKITFLA